MAPSSLLPSSPLPPGATLSPLFRRPLPALALPTLSNLFGGGSRRKKRRLLTLLSLPCPGPVAGRRPHYSWEWWRVSRLIPLTDASVGRAPENPSSCDNPPASNSIQQHGMRNFENVIAAFLIFVQISLPLPLVSWDPWFISSSEAVLYSPDTKVPRSGELALRRAIPANANMKAIQESLEGISYLLRIPQRKPYGTMENDVKKALKIATDEKESILAGIPTENQGKGSTLYASLLDGKGGLQDLLEFVEEKDADKVSVGLSTSLDTLAELELLQAPGLSFLLPEQYLKYPRLTGRGIVEFTIEKGDGSTFFPSAGGEPKGTATIQVVLDGYSAPLTAGNFAKLSGLGGLSFDEGQFSVFGYTTVGRDILSQIKTGDSIQSAKLLQGKDRLVLPNED